MRVSAPEASALACGRSAQSNTRRPTALPVHKLRLDWLAQPPHAANNIHSQPESETNSGWAGTFLLRGCAIRNHLQWNATVTFLRSELVRQHKSRRAVSLRLGVDLDGTLADLSSSYREIRQRFGPVKLEEAAGADEAGEESLKEVRAEGQRNDLVWQQIQQTTDFWLGLEEIEAGAVELLYDMSTRLGWEVFFVTQRPQTAGRTVQAQTQEWLKARGFASPSVLTLRGSRGRAAAALDLDYLIDDQPKNCIDVIADSRCKPILIVRRDSSDLTRAAERLNVPVVRTFAQALREISKSPRLPPSALRSILDALGLC